MPTNGLRWVWTLGSDFGRWGQWEGLLCGPQGPSQAKLGPERRRAVSVDC